MALAFIDVDKNHLGFLYILNPFLANDLTFYTP